MYCSSQELSRAKSRRRKEEANLRIPRRGRSWLRRMGSPQSFAISSSFMMDARLQKGLHSNSLIAKQKNTSRCRTAVVLVVWATVCFTLWKRDFIGNGVHFLSPVHPPPPPAGALPRQIVSSLELPTTRGGGWLTPKTGCRISRWLYTRERSTPPHLWECNGAGSQTENERQLVPALLTVNDTVYVPHSAVEQFVDDALIDINVDIVVISGQFSDCSAPSVSHVERLLSNKHIIRWFLQNVQKYAGRYSDHPKIDPFPYGLKATGHGGQHAFSSYKAEFFRSVMNLQETSADSEQALIYAGPLGATSSERDGIPRSPSLRPLQYFEEMAKHKYILSPNGDRPECFRHYEAIGLGVMPITQLHPIFHRHLAGSVIFNNSNWSLESLRSEWNPNPKTVNRNIIREDYWIDYVDRIVERKLNWRVFNDTRLDSQELVEQTYLADALEIIANVA